MNASDLRAWTKARKLSHQQAADLLGLTLQTFRGKLYRPQRPVGRQTERIVQLLDAQLVSTLPASWTWRQPYVASGYDGC